MKSASMSSMSSARPKISAASLRASPETPSRSVSFAARRRRRFSRCGRGEGGGEGEGDE